MTTQRRRDRLGPLHVDPNREDGFFARVDEDTGFLRVDARLTRTGVFRYADSEGNEWGELRTDEQVFDPEALRSFHLTTVTNDHPDDFVSASNVKDVQVGTVGTDVRKDGRFVRASILITDKDVIRSIRDGKTELSCGYTADVILDSGTTEDGVPFAARQTKIRGNHLAIVTQGRAGADCNLFAGRGDASSDLVEIHPMQTKKIKIDGVDYVVPIQVADAYEAARSDDDSPPDTPPAEETPPVEDTPPAAETPPVESNDDNAALRARVDILEADAVAAPARMDARVDLVANARTVLGSDVTVRGISDSALMRAIVLKVRPGFEAKLDANTEAGYLRFAYEDAVAKHSDGEENVRDTSIALFGAHVPTEHEDAELDQLISDYHTGGNVTAEGTG